MSESNNGYNPYSYNNPYHRTPPLSQGQGMPQGGQGYESYDAAGAIRPAYNRGLLEKILGEDIAARVRSPLFATVSLIAVGAVFAGILALSYSSGAKDETGAPILQAEALAFREIPNSPGGMDVPYQDSTVFNALRDDPMQGRPVIENLLDPAPQERPVDRMAAMPEIEDMGAQAAQNVASVADGAVEAVSSAVSDGAQVVAEAAQSAGQAVQASVERVSASAPAELGLQEPQPPKIVETQEKITGEELARQAEAVKPDRLHAAGSSPETLAFVRSVLDEKDGKVASAPAAAPTTASASASAARAAAVEPAAGNATAGSATAPYSVTAGSHYVQLGSVSSQNGAAGEWTRLQKEFSLQGLSHRIQEANLGERGIYYRIQAGPMSRESANKICGDIKAKKPGACLVVQ